MTLTAPDILDLKIIDLLRQDARRTFAYIGQQIGLSAPAVKRRVDRLQSVGVITGYRALIDHAKLGRPLAAFVELRFAGDTKVDEIATIGADLPQVEAIYTIAGNPDALGYVRVRDVEELKNVIDRLRQSSGVIETKTLVVLGTRIPVGAETSALSLEPMPMFDQPVF